jgi:hypothetical protein
MSALPESTVAQKTPGSSNMITKCFIVPYFGKYPEWMPHWISNTERMRGLGYDFLFDTDEAAFQDRVRDKLGIVCPPMTGSGRIWNYRPALGVLYEDEIKDFDFWGICDFDCVFGRVEKWVTDDFLADIDIHSNHHSYICGPWTLFRNTPLVNNLFRHTGEWKERMLGDDWSYGWAEKGFSEIVDQAHDEGIIRKAYTFWQSKSQDNFDHIHWDGDRLMDGNEEIFKLHFRRTKVYPLGAIRR